MARTRVGALAGPEEADALSICRRAVLCERAPPRRLPDRLNGTVQQVGLLERLKGELQQIWLSDRLKAELQRIVLSDRLEAELQRIVLSDRLERDLRKIRFRGCTSPGDAFGGAGESARDWAGKLAAASCR
jgi:hypothetical protein